MKIPFSDDHEFGKRFVMVEDSQDCATPEARCGQCVRWPVLQSSY